MPSRPFRLFLVMAAAVLAVGCAQIDAAGEGPEVAEIRRAADRGDAEAQYQMGLRYATGDGVTRHHVRARGWFELAAAQGHRGAQYRLGLAYAAGRGVSRDPERALAWLTQAAEGGHVRAQYRLGEAYLHGRGTPREPAWAARWLEMAALRGHTEAQVALGVGHAAGSGLPIDRVQAWTWLRIAEADGHEQAAALRHKIEPALTAAEMRAAEARFADWQPLRPNQPIDEPTVRFAQYALFQLGYEPGPVTGRLGPATAAALARYGEASGVGAAGSTLTPAMIERLRMDLATLPAEDLKADLRRE
ncbi:MAG: peptidoglycan-binding protein [Rhodospirillales bacterium]